MSLRRERLLRLGQYGVAGLPLAPDRAHDEAFQRPDGFGARFALLAPPCEIGLCRERVPGLREHNPIEDGVQAAVPAPIYSGITAPCVSRIGLPRMTLYAQSSRDRERVPGVAGNEGVELHRSAGCGVRVTYRAR